MPYPYKSRVDADTLNDLVERRLVSVRQHPTLPLFIYNYTKDAQIAWAWKHYPLLGHCRGLILNDQYQVVAQGFRKFFNHGDEDHTQYEGEPIILEKLDGSMIVGFTYENNVIFTTRGTFDAPQAISASALWHFKYKDRLIPEGVSLIMELIGPNNRHVVDYPEDELVLIGGVGVTGNDASYLALQSAANNYGIPLVKRIDITLDHALTLNTENEEGFIYVIESVMSGLRVVVFRSKIKFATYMAAHRVVFGESWKEAAYEAWKTHELPALINVLPPYHRTMVNDYVFQLNNRRDYVLTEANNIINSLVGDPLNRDDRAKMAREINQHADVEVRTMCYSLLSGKSYTIKAIK